jgi:hypothetical protein
VRELDRPGDRLDAGPYGEILISIADGVAADALFLMLQRAVAHTRRRGEIAAAEKSNADGAFAAPSAGRGPDSADVAPTGASDERIEWNFPPRS